MKPSGTGVEGVSRTNERADGGRRPLFAFAPRGYRWHWRIIQRLHKDQPLFRDVVRECDREIQRSLDWSLDELLGRDPDTIARGFPEDYFEPTLTAIQIAQVELWRRRGVEASAVVGYSGGEFAAAYTAGALGAEEAMRVPCAWSRLVKEGGVPEGGVILVQTRLEEATRLRATMQRPVDIISESAPKSRMFGGDTEAIDAFASLLDRNGVAYQRPPIPFAYHVPFLDSGKADFLRRLAGLTGRPATMPVYSAASGGLLRDARFDAHHWHEVLTRPALVTSVVRGLLEDDYDRFLSISLGLGVMLPFRHVASTLGKEVVVSSSLACLAEDEAPFRRQDSTWTAAMCSALKRRLSPARRGWSRTDASGFS